MRGNFLLYLCLLIAVLPACYSHEHYRVAAKDLDLARAPASETAASPAATVSAVRESDGKQVLVKVEALQPGSETAMDANTRRVEAKAKNRRILAGSLLTYVGSVVSVVGTILFAVGRVKNNDAIFYGGAATALSAEPMMGIGTALWISGTLHPPYEVISR